MRPELLIAALLCASFTGDMILQKEVTATLSGKVTRVADGDTLTVLVDKTPTAIRLESIDAPEKGQAFSEKSKQALTDKTAGKTVTVLVTGKDRYSRTIGVVIVEDHNVNLEMVAEGWAWCYDEYNKDPQVQKLEDKARAKKVGMWAAENNLEPWEYRRRQREAQAEAKAKAVEVTPPVARPPPVTQEAPTLSHWINTSSGKRHNKSCQYYGNTKQGRACGPNDGVACKVGGG